MTSVGLTILYAAEPLLLAVALIALLRSREQKRFPALFAYVALRLGSSVILHLLLQIHRFVTIDNATAYACYFYTYWASYVAGAVVVFLVIQEMFQFAMEPFPRLEVVGHHILPLGRLYFLCGGIGGHAYPRRQRGQVSPRRRRPGDGGRPHRTSMSTRR